MRTESLSLIAALALAASSAFGQQPQAEPSPPAASPAPQPQPQAAPAALQPLPQAPVPPDTGFFRPTDDPTLSRFPDVAGAERERGAAEGLMTPADPAIFAAQVRAAEVMERELDRAERADARARAEAARQPAPLIVSPLDGTAPIVSPLGR